MKRIGFIAGSRIKHWEDWFPSLQTHVYEQDDFEGDILKDQWDVAVGAGCSVAIAAGQNGLCPLTTVAGDNLYASMARELNLSSLLYAGVEARLKLDDITNCTIEMGLVDAKNYANGRAFDDYELTGGLPTPVATDAAIIGFDPTDSPLHPQLNGVSAIAGTGTVNALGVTLTNLTFVILKVQLDALGTARYYVNNALLATQLLAITPATPLTPWMAISNKAGAIARVLTPDYCKWWQRRV
jgi:hypothetical protein